MSEFKGKTAVISGGAEGIGFGVAEALGHQGMNIVIGDIDAQQLEIAKSKLEEQGIPVLAMTMDVTKLEQWQALADQAIERFEKIHMVVNNAGVASAPGPVEQTNYTDWQWVTEVNLFGVIKGMQTIVPHIKAHGEGGWALNVASMAGMRGVPYAGAYTATKVAVVGMSEAWAEELLPFDIKVSVLCPAFVKTRIHLSQRNRQAEHKDTSADKASSDGPLKENPAQKLVENGIPAPLVGKRVVEALQANEFYIFTHPSHRDHMQERAKGIDEAFARAADSELLEGIVDGPIGGFN